jgi:hypothetical protein
MQTARATGPMTAGTRLARLRWRRAGAWLWPTFVATIVLDAIIGTTLPPAGDSQTFFSAALVAMALNLLAVVLLSRPLGALLRRRRPDLPILIARNYAGTAAVVSVSAVLLIVGLAHQSTITADASAMRDAIIRAQAWIGDRAPAEFRRNLGWVSTFAIVPGSVYRTCVRSSDHSKTYCVIVRTKLPFGSSVTFSGYEPNQLFALGVN